LATEADGVVPPEDIGVDEGAARAAVVKDRDLERGPRNARGRSTEAPAARRLKAVAAVVVGRTFEEDVRLAGTACSVERARHQLRPEPLVLVGWRDAQGAEHGSIDQLLVVVDPAAGQQHMADDRG